MRWFLIIALILVLIIDLWVPRRISQYEQESTAKYHTKKQQQDQSIGSPFILVLEDAGVSVIDFSTRNEHAIIALSTLAIAIFTVALVWVGNSQWKALRQEFDATHPPKLIVRRVTLENREPASYVQYIVTNVGDTPATITGSDATINIDVNDGHLPFFPPYSGRTNVMGRMTIPVGGRKILRSYRGELDPSMAAIMRGQMRLMFIGWMTYRNPGGYHRYTAFGRIYEARRGAFTTMDGEVPEYDRYDYTS